MKERDLPPSNSPVERLRSELQRNEQHDPEGYTSMELKLLNDLEARLPKIVEEKGMEGLRMMQSVARRATAQSSGLGRDKIKRRLASINRIFNAFVEEYGMYN